MPPPLLAATWDGSDYSGTAYVFERTDSEWSYVQQLVSPRGGLDLFGDSVAVYDDTVLIAAPGWGEFGDYFGSAYVFSRVTRP